MKCAALLMTFFFILCNFCMSDIVFAKCRYYTNSRGNLELKCDSIDEYPDYNRSDDHDVNPDAWNRGHEAGYEWAKDNEIDDISDCTGYSRSFVEGCIRAVEEAEEEAEDEDEDEDEDDES